jgi:hypothetical protein
MWYWFLSIIDAIGNFLTMLADEMDEPVLTDLVIVYLHTARRLDR